MRISVIIPSYNQAAFLEATIRSVVEQEYPDKEIIVMDGGSTDGSVDIIRKYEKHLTSWVSQPDGGQTNALAAGFALATGAIIGWINSDDLLSPGALERTARKAAEIGTPDAVFYGGFEIVDENGRVEEVYYGTPMTRWVARAIGPVVSQQGSFFGRDAYHRVGRLDATIQYAMDLDLWMRFFSAGVPFVAIPAIQGQFRRHSMQKGHSVEWLKRCDLEEAAIQRQYHLAARGSLRWKVARQTQRLLSLTLGKYYLTLALRVLRRQRIREFTSSYSP